MFTYINQSLYELVANIFSGVFNKFDKYFEGLETSYLENFSLVLRNFWNDLLPNLFPSISSSDISSRDQVQGHS